MRMFWHSLFQPADKPRPEQENAHASSPPIPMPQASAPRFNPYPPMQKEWAFGVDATGQHLNLLWKSVLAEDRQPLGDRTDFLPFVKALGRACANMATSVEGAGMELGNLSLLIPSSAPVAVPGVASELRGIPAEVVRGLAEVVLSATVCRHCGQRLSTSPVSDPCCKHGAEQPMSWWPALPTSEELFGGGTAAPFPLRKAVGTSGRIGSDGETKVNHLDAAHAMPDGRRRAVRNGEDMVAGANVGGGLMRRRESFIETLRVLDASTRWSHTREELARWDRSGGESGGGGGGLAEGFACFLDGLSARMTALAQRQNGRFRRGRSALKPETESSVHDDIVFFLRCLVPLARIVSNSPPASSAWYALVNEHAVPGLGLSHHPWPRGTDVATARKPRQPVSGSPCANLDYAAAWEEKAQSRPERRSYDGENNGSKDSEVSFAAMSSVANTDEWSAALVNAGLVQSLVRSLQACLEIRPMLGLAVEAEELQDDAPLGQTKSIPMTDTVVRKESDCCLGFSLAVAQVEVMLAIGGLLSAHPQAARDRFLLVGGMVTLSRMVSVSPCDRDKERDGSSDGGAYTEGTAIAAATAAPFMHEHCCLVALQLLRVCLRSGADVALPVDLLKGATGLVESLPHAMHILWEKHARGECRGVNRSLAADLLRRGRTEVEHGTSPRRSACSRGGLPFCCPSEVSLDRSRDRENCSVRAEACGGNATSAPKDPSSVAQVHFPLTLRSFLLCRPPMNVTSKHGEALRSCSTVEKSGWQEDGLEKFARRKGPSASVLVDSLQDRLSTTLNDIDIWGLELEGRSREEGQGIVLGKGGERRAMSEGDRASAYRALGAFRSGILDVIADCATQTREGTSRQSVEAKGIAVDVGGEVVGTSITTDSLAMKPVESVLRSATNCFVELFLYRGDPPVASTQHKLGHTDRGTDRAQPRRTTKGCAPVTAIHEAGAACPTRQLVALSFFLQVMRRWPRLAIKLMRDGGVWDLLFSDHFLAGGSCLIAGAIDIMESPNIGVPAAATNQDSDRSSNGDSESDFVDDVVVGWGLVHNATLVLLEAVMVAGQIFRAETFGAKSGAGAQEMKRKQGQNAPLVLPNEPLEVGVYMRFLAGGNNCRPSSIASIQGCRWLGDALATEPLFGGGLTLLSPSLRATALRLAFTIFDRGQGCGLDSRVFRTTTWPLLHASFSLAVDLVSAEGPDQTDALFQAAATFSTAAGVAVPDIHRRTASLTSDASTHGIQALGTSWTAGSIGSCTPGSNSTDSPRLRSTFYFGDIQLAPPQLPPPLPELLFKAALDPRLRRAAFFMITRLGVQAGRVGLAVSGQATKCSLEFNAGASWGMRDTVAEVLSGLVEGYLCLCERAAAIIAPAALSTEVGTGDGEDGLMLLLDALKGAGALIRAEESAPDVTTGVSVVNAEDGAESRTPTRVRLGNWGLSPLLQEAFREHWAFARLLVVLERVAGPVSVGPSTDSNARLKSTEGYPEIVKTCLSLLTALMAGNSLGKKAFRNAIAEHVGSVASVTMATRTATAATSSTGASATNGVNGTGCFAALAGLASVVPPVPLLRTLMEMLMDGELPDDVLPQTDGDVSCETGERREAVDATSSPAEIRNPLVVPLVFRLLPDWPASEQRLAMDAFRLLLGGTSRGMVNRSMCCDVQPSLIDQLLDMLPRLDEGSDWDNGLQGLAIELVRRLGSHSITVAQLKKMFRLMQPLPAVAGGVVVENHTVGSPRPVSRSFPSNDATATSSTEAETIAPAVSSGVSSVASSTAPLQPPWLCGLLRALRGMMEDRPGPQRFFLLDGVSSGLRLPPIPRWPAPKGYTFCAWVRLEAAPSSRNNSRAARASAAGAPCLFSFCGERGQGVAACFIPFRTGRERERDVGEGAAATAGTKMPSARVSAQPRDEQSQQFELELRVGAGQKKSPAVIRFPGAIVTAGKWVFVAISHAPNGWGQRGEAAALVDTCWHVVPSPFPRFREGGVPAAGVACYCPLVKEENTAESGGAGARVAGRPILCSLHGQMGPVYLFAGNLPEGLLRGIRQLGPGYAFNFEPPQVDSREIALLRSRDPYLLALSEEVAGASGSGGNTGMPDGASGGGVGTRQPERGVAAAAAESAARAATRQKLHVAALSGTLTPLIILAYNPSVWGGEYFLDNTPDHNNVQWTDGSHPSTAKAGGGGGTPARACAASTRRARVIYSMSGSQAHVLIHPRRTHTSRGGGGDADGGESRVSEPQAPRTRASSAVSSEDNFFGNDGSTIMSSATLVHPRPRPGCMHAMRLPGTRECVTRDVRDALDCLGGVKVLLPLFAQYDHGVRFGRGVVSYQTDPRLNETVMALLAGTLRDSVPNRRFLRRYDGLSLVHHCLERVSPQHMTPCALTQVCRLTDRLGSWSEDWADSAIACLLAPSRLWVFAPPDAQLTLAGVLRGLARRCPGRMRRVIGLQRCLDALDLYYWYSPPVQKEEPGGANRSHLTDLDGTGKGGEVPRSGGIDREGGGSSTSGASVSKDWSYVSRQWLNPSTGELLGCKASGAPLREIRARLLDAAILMVCDGNGVGRGDVAAVLGFLHGCRDDVSRCEALRLVLRLTDDPRQAARFTVASGYVANDVYTGDHGVDGVPLDDGSPNCGPGRGGGAVAIFLSLLRAHDPTVRLLALLALAQVLIACLRIDDHSGSSDDWPDADAGRRRQSSTNRPKDEVASETGSASGDNPANAVTATPSATCDLPSTAVVVGFMGNADAKAEELAILTGASAAREGWSSTSNRERSRQGQSDEKTDVVEGVLELRGSAWEHVGLPRDRVFDVLLWAQRQVAGALRNNNGEAGGQSGVEPQSASQGNRSPPAEAADAERTVARVTLGVLQGLLVGELPSGLVASVVSSSDGREQRQQQSYTAPIVAPPLDVILDPFFLEMPFTTGPPPRRTSWRNRGQGAEDGIGIGGSPVGRHSRSRQPRTGRNTGRTDAGAGAKFDDTTSIVLPFLIRLPEAFPALCQQVATAPEGASPRGAVIETLVAAVHDQKNSKAILSVDSWQQYLLSIVSSAQGRQAVSVTTANINANTAKNSSGAATAAFTFPFEDGSPRTNWRSNRDKSVEGKAGSAGWNERTAGDDTKEEERLVDQTVRLICWLAMCQAREGTPGRPGAGFAALQDTMSFLRCQADLGVMECVSVGERMLRHMVSLLRREADALEHEVNGWARMPHHPSLRPALGAGGYRGAAAVLACMWPLASLIVEFIAIPPVANPPAAAASGAPTPAAAAMSVLTAAADYDKNSSSHEGNDSSTCPSPMQALLRWLDTGMQLRTQSPMPSARSPNVRAAATSSPPSRMGSSSPPPAAATSVAGWRAWELLDAAVDLVGPTGDTLLWDARYRHNLFVEAAVSGGENLPVCGVVDPSAARVLDWGRRELDTSGRDDARSPRPPAASRKHGSKFLGGVRGSGGHGGSDAWFVDAKGKENPLADAGGVPWMLVRLLLAVFVSGGAATGYSEGVATGSSDASKSYSRRGSVSSNSSAGSSSSNGGGAKGGGGGGSGPPSIALFALQRLIALLNSLESSRYKCYGFEVLHVAARVSSALRTTYLTPQSAWVLGALQLLAKCLAAQAAQIEDLLVAAEERLDVEIAKRAPNKAPHPPNSSTAMEDEPPSSPRPRLVFRRRSKPSGWWLWDLLLGAGGGPKVRRQRSTPKGVLHQIAAETPSLAAFPTADLALEIIRRTLGIELPGQHRQDGHGDGGGHAGTKSNSDGKSKADAAAALTWDLLVAAFEPISEEGAEQEASGLLVRLGERGVHAHAVQVLERIRMLEGRGFEAGFRVPASVVTLGSTVKDMEAKRVLELRGTDQRASHRRQAQWEAVLKQLATERGPWGRGVEAADLDSVYWMLNPREDDRGRRLKLVRNPHGCRHTIASERTRGVTRSLQSSSRLFSRTTPRWGWRGVGSTSASGDRRGDIEGNDDSVVGGGGDGAALSMNLDQDQQEGQELTRRASRTDVRAISAQTSLWQDLCKYQHKSVKMGRIGEDWENEDEEEEEEEEEDETDEEYDTDEEGTAGGVDGSDDGRDASRKGRRRTDAGATAMAQTPATFSSPADVVRPFYATPGTVSLLGDRLVFTRSPEIGASGSVGGVEETRGGVGGGKHSGQTLSDNFRWALRPAPSTSWPTLGLRRVLFRPYGGLRFAALELWFRGGVGDESGGGTGGAEGSSLLLGLPTEALARILHQELRRTRPPALEPFLGRLPATIVARSKAGTWGASGAGGVGMSSGAGALGHGAAAGAGRAAAVAAVAATAAREAARTPLTQAWIRRRCGVTNFDYLRGLNAAAGRTTADLSRYPVFPWVLSERAWRVEELDLKDERNFRDLEWPMGAQRPEQREALHMRYESMEYSYLEQQRMGGEMAELALPPFHHGSHYSSSAYVLWYLIRLEPFTSLHIHLQDGRFDKPDRLFQSLPDSYSSCTRNPGDVKEAIPELYYLPEMLVNGTGLDLGRPQCSDKPLGDVELPPWAHGDPWEFVRRHREALESEHVSLRLHKWIDLVFGSRQRPPALNRGERSAVESCNVFFHLTYPGAVDLPRLREQDPQLYESTMKQIEEFGQAPAQLFQSPHPPRLSLVSAEVVRPLASPVPGANTIPLPDSNASMSMAAAPPEIEQWPPASTAAVSTGPGFSSRDVHRSGTTRSAHGVLSYPRERVCVGAVLVICDLLPWAERLVTVDTRRAIGYHGWYIYSPEMCPPFRLRPDATSIEATLRRHGGNGALNAGGAGGGGGSERFSRRLGVPFAPGGMVSSRLLEPPPSSGVDWCGGHAVGGDSSGNSSNLSPLLGGLGGSYASLASMGSLLWMFQSAPAAESAHPQATWSSPLVTNFSLTPPHAQSAGLAQRHEDGNSVAAAAATAGVSATFGTRGDACGGEWGQQRAGAGGTTGDVSEGGLGLGSHLFAVHAKARLLFSGGHWDSSFRVTALDTGRLVVSVARHRDVVTSLSLADGGVGCRRLVTASRDTTLMVWDVEPWGKPPVSASSLMHVLYGHDTPVTCVCASASLDVVVSSGEDGTLVVHSLWGGEYIRTITPRSVQTYTSTTAPAGDGRTAARGQEKGNDRGKEANIAEAATTAEGATAAIEDSSRPQYSATATARARSKLSPPWPSVEWVGVSAAGYVVAYSPADATLRSYAVNGHALGAATLAHGTGPLRAFVFSEDGSVLLSGGNDRVVTLRWAHNLAVANDGGREGCGAAILTGAAPPLAGVAGAGAGVEKFGSAVRCLALTAGERHLLVGLENGTLGVLALDAKYLRQRLRSKLDQLGI